MDCKKAGRELTHIDFRGVKGAVSMSRPLVQRYQLIQQSWVAVSTRRRPPLATVRDTARRRPREQAADKRRFTSAKASRAQCWQGQEVRVSGLGGGSSPTDQTPWLLYLGSSR